MRPLRAVALLIAVPLVALSAACGAGDATPTAAPRATTVVPITEANTPAIEFPTATPSKFRQAPQLAGLAGWLNSDPVTISGLNAQHRVVLIDFWTYTCVNCLRTLPYLKIWDARYRDHGLTIIGVHAPEFEFEKDAGNVQDAVMRLGIEYAVAQDNEMTTWDAFNNAYWPAKYLIDAGGGIAYQHFGEGNYLETEHQIRTVLEDAGWDLSGVPEGGYGLPRTDPQARKVTPEMYGGYYRNYGFYGSYAGQDTYYRAPDTTALYTDPGGHQDGKWYLQGLWTNEAESIVHARQTDGLEDYIALQFNARSVNVVVRPAHEGAFDVAVEMDGRSLSSEEAGADVTIGGNGQSVFSVSEPRMYRIVELPSYGVHELKLRSSSDAFAVYAFTFGAYTEGA